MAPPVQASPQRMPRVADATAPIPVVTPTTAGSPTQGDVTFVPLAVTVGDGFKFGCGFFLAMVIALLVGFVALAALFVLTGLSVLNLPFGR
jgi:hypothetical protein